MPNSIDFRADQIQTKQIIVTGSGAGTTKLLIYGIEAQGSPVNEGLINQAVFPSDTTIGSDVFLYVSGAVNTKDSATVRGTSVFGGDLVVSGSLYNGSPAPAPAIRGIYSHAEGLSTFAIGSYSHAEGSGSNAYSIASHAEGRETIAYSDYSHAEGYLTRAENLYAHAEGYLTTGSGIASHAEGSGSYAFGIASHAEGYYTKTTSTGLYAHAEGYLTTGSGEASHAEGYKTVAWGQYSHAGGYETIASGSGQTVVGQYNARDNVSSLFVVGSGSSDVDRGDILRVDPSEFHLSGGINYRFVNISDNYDITLRDYMVLVTIPSLKSITVTLPDVTGVKIGKTYLIRREAVTATESFTLTVNKTASDRILFNGTSSIIYTLPGGVGLYGNSILLTYIGSYTAYSVTKRTWMIMQYTTS